MADTTAENILRAVGGALTEVAPLTSGPWRLAIGGLGVAVSFVGELIAHGMDPVVTIAEIRSVLPDHAAARDRLKALIDAKAKK